MGKTVGNDASLYCRSSIDCLSCVTDSRDWWKLDSGGTYCCSPGVQPPFGFYSHIIYPQTQDVASKCAEIEPISRPSVPITTSTFGIEFWTEIIVLCVIFALIVLIMGGIWMLQKRNSENESEIIFLGQTRQSQIQMDAN